MSGIYIRRFLNNFSQNYAQQMYSAKGASNSFSLQNQSEIAKPAEPQTTLAQTAQNMVANGAKEISQILQLPKNINEFIYMLQRGLTQGQFNQMFSNQLLAQRNSLSQLQAQILAQLDGLNMTTAKEMVNAQLSTQLQASLKNLDILSNGMINLNQISSLLQQNGKEALTKLIMSMTEISKAGITDLTQMKEMAKLINASIAVASENNPQKTLKLLLLLYLP